jgi:hypothetical protein
LLKKKHAKIDKKSEKKSIFVEKNFGTGKWKICRQRNVKFDMSFTLSLHIKIFDLSAPLISLRQIETKAKLFSEILF